MLDELLPVTAMSLDILQRNLRTQELLDQTREQARQLEKQTEELQHSQDELLVQKDELLVQQEVLTEQRERLEASEAELRKGSEQLQRTNFLADSALDLTQAGYWHVPLDGSGWYNSSERAARIFGDIPNARPPLPRSGMGRARSRGRRGGVRRPRWRTSRRGGGHDSRL